MKKALPLLAMLCATPALAAWKQIEGGVSAAPTQTNSTIQAIVLHCVDGAAIDVYSSGDGAIRPAAGGEVSDYFYKPGFIRAVVDGRAFPLVAAGSGDAVVLFSESEADDGDEAPLDPALIEALGSGKLLTFGFDLTPASGADGSAFETLAAFELEGHGETIRSAIGSCD